MISLLRDIVCQTVFSELLNLFQLPFFRYYCEYLAFLVDLSLVQLEDSSSLIEFARKNKFKKSEEFLSDALLFS